MAGLSPKIDPLSGDFVRDSNGRWETTTGSDTSVQLALRLVRGWWGGEVGSTIAALHRGIGPADPVEATSEAVREALAPLVSRGAIGDLSIVVERESPLVLRVQWFDLQAQRPASQLVAPFGR